MSSIICCRKAPRLGTLEQICLALGTTPNELLMPEICAECLRRRQEEGSGE